MLLTLVEKINDLFLKTLLPYSYSFNKVIRLKLRINFVCY